MRPFLRWMHLPQVQFLCGERNVPKKRYRWIVVVLCLRDCTFMMKYLYHSFDIPKTRLCTHKQKSHAKHSTASNKYALSMGLTYLEIEDDILHEWSFLIALSIDHSGKEQGERADAKRARPYFIGPSSIDPILCPKLICANNPNG